MTFKRIIDENDAYARLALRLNIGDKHHVVEAGDTGFQQPKLFPRFALRGDVLQRTHQLYRLVVLPNCLTLRANPNRPPASGCQGQFQIPGCAVFHCGVDGRFKY